MQLDKMEESLNHFRKIIRGSKTDGRPGTRHKTEGTRLPVATYNIKADSQQVSEDTEGETDFHCLVKKAISGKLLQDSAVAILFCGEHV